MPAADRDLIEEPTGVPNLKGYPSAFEAYLLSRGGTVELSARDSWRLLTLVDAVRAEAHLDTHALKRSTGCSTASRILGGV